jgi:hypothetical protein
MTLGVGAMLHALGGGSQHSATEYYGQKIVSAAIVDNRLRLALGNGKSIAIWDDGQSCCEARYMSTDDDVSKIVGGTITRIEARNAPDLPDEYGSHECVFVEVGTDECFITIVNHNEHNGYYGGFGLTITEDA